jgi:hypothetical protein
LALQLHLIVQQPHLLARLERREPNIRAPITPEGVPKSAIPTRTDLALDCEVNFCQVVDGKLRQVCVGIGAFLLVLGFKTLGETAGTVLAGAPPLGVGLAGLSYRR